MNLEFNLILEIVTSFYQKANFDILIGYHFRHIEDFDTHLPRIASFWQLQLTGKITRREELPFDIINLHKSLKINKGEVHRWVTLFIQTLEEFYAKEKITNLEKETWIKKIEPFKNKILTLS